MQVQFSNENSPINQCAYNCSEKHPSALIPGIDKQAFECEFIWLDSRMNMNSRITLLGTCKYIFLLKNIKKVESQEINQN